MHDNFYSKYSIEIDRFIKQSLQEDIETGDHSSSACLDSDKIETAHLLVKEPCVIAGISLAEKIFKEFDPELTLEKYFEEGTGLEKGEIVFSVTGKAKSILATERLVLNCMQRMSG
ncbi:nicotinate-nucleotide diphosphorylase (carboxylating), partial [Flavobacteriaceae bacterium]|nr:nicotinate-nucleotide diphosphorylase (carboxylating) [Flavobacteriaceae bacterium]